MAQGKSIHAIHPNASMIGGTPHQVSAMQSAKQAAMMHAQASGQVNDTVSQPLDAVHGFVAQSSPIRRSLT